VTQEHIHIKKEKLGKMIVLAGIANSLDIDHALQSQQVFGGSLGTNLVEAGILDDEVLAVFLSQQIKIERVKKKELESIPEEVISQIPKKAAIELMMVPVSLKGKHIVLAMADPTDARVLHKVQGHLNLNLLPKVAPQFTIHMALKKYYDVSLPPRISRLLHQRQFEHAQDIKHRLKDHLDQHCPSGSAIEYFFHYVQNLELIPVVSPIEDMRGYDFTPELVFIFQQIDGVSTIGDMIQMSVFTKLDTLRALMFFHKNELIYFQDAHRFFSDEDSYEE